MELTEKYRPKSLNEVVGNESVVRSIGALVDQKKLPHAILLSGDTGCGKTTLARIIGTVLGAYQEEEFYEMDTAHFGGIEMVRELRKNMRYGPKRGHSRVWLIDEAHKLSNAAQNGLLKALEDPPPHVYFILATTDPQKLLPTLRGRCHHWAVEKLSEKLLHRHLKSICKKEGINVPRKVLFQIVEKSGGHVRDALTILGKVIYLDEDEMEAAAENYSTTTAASIDLCRALIKERPWKEITQIINDLKKENAEDVRRHVLGYCDSILSKGEDPNAYLVMSSFAEHNTYDIGMIAIRLAAWEALME